jgi:hypothetical protein
VQVIAGQVSGTLFNVESARLVELETKVRWLGFAVWHDLHGVPDHPASNPKRGTSCECQHLLCTLGSPHVSPACSAITVRCPLPQAAENGEAQPTKPTAKQTARDAALRARDASRTLQALPSEVRS